jgi:hypothetical protein
MLKTLARAGFLSSSSAMAAVEHKQHKHLDFYREVLRTLAAEGHISREDSVLAVCAGDSDAYALAKEGFKRVTISNLDGKYHSMFEGGLEDFETLPLDLESPELPEEAYDVVVVHSGLHHLACPPAGITQMYRMARKAILAFEPNLSWYTTLGARLGFGQVYEVGAVQAHGYQSGGHRNGPIPNYVYRFCPAEVRRVIRAFNPVGEHAYRFFYKTRPPRFVGLPAAIRPIAQAISPLFKLMGALCPALANNIAFYVEKPKIPADLFPWLKEEEGKVVPNPDGFP